VPHLPEILLDRVETPFIFMLGIAGENLYKQVEDSIKDGTYIIQLDGNKIFQRPHASTIINRSGTTKEKIDEDLPDLPLSLYNDLYSELKDFSREIRRKQHEFTNKQVEEIRKHFFHFFVKLLRYYE
jgi:hypothetical protein